MTSHNTVCVISPNKLRPQHEPTSTAGTATWTMLSSQTTYGFRECDFPAGTSLGSPPTTRTGGFASNHQFHGFGLLCRSICDHHLPRRNAPLFNIVLRGQHTGTSSMIEWIHICVVMPAHLIFSSRDVKSIDVGHNSGCQGIRRKRFPL
jgi:hypothetical protein